MKTIIALPNASTVRGERWYWFVVEWLDAKGRAGFDLCPSELQRLDLIESLPDDTKRIVVYTLESDQYSIGEALSYVEFNRRIED